MRLVDGDEPGEMIEIDECRSAPGHDPCLAQPRRKRDRA